MANKERKIQFASHEVGLVLDFSIWRSADSGISWRKVLEDSEFNAFEALSGQFAVAAGAQGRFAVSHDAGATWEVTRIVPAGNTIAIAASDPANIFIASDSGLLLLSTDQGRTWTEIPLPSPSFVIQDLASCEAGKLWLIGRPREEAIRTEAYYLWLTRGGKAGQEKADWFEARDRLLRHSLCFTPDYGQSWTTAEVPHYEFDSLKCLGAEQVVALSPRFGCAAAELRNGVVSTSHVAAVPESWCCDAIAWDGVCYAGYSHLSGFFSVTRDGGKNYRTVGILDNGVFNVFFVDELRGWARVGSFGGIMVWGTADGGLNWEKLTRAMASPFGFG